MRIPIKTPAVPHQSLIWAIEAWNLRDNYVARRDPSGDGHVDALTEAAVILGSFDLVRQIESTLKRRLERQLRSEHGSAWWSGLPPMVRKSAAARHRWATLQMGRRRAGNQTSIHWLSFGDILKALAAISPTGWRACLDAERFPRRRFERQLYRIKSFRDSDLAHPRPRPISNHSIRKVCDAIRAMPALLRPTEWARFLALLGTVASLAPDTQRSLADELAFGGRAKHEHVTVWLSCPSLEPPESCRHDQRLSPRATKWRRALLAQCAGIDFTRHVFFTYGTPLSR